MKVQSLDPEVIQTFVEKYDDMLSDGLSSSKSYLRLAEENGLVLAIQPMFGRLNDSTVFVGGKLRVSRVPINDGSKGSAAAAEAEVEKFLNWTKMPKYAWQNVSSVRLSMMVGTAYKAGPTQFKQFSAIHQPKDLAMGLVKDLEKITGISVRGKMKIYNALTFLLEHGIPVLFAHEATVPAKQVGTVGETSGNVFDLNAFKANKAKK